MLLACVCLEREREGEGCVFGGGGEMKRFVFMYLRAAPCVSQTAAQLHPTHRPREATCHTYKYICTCTYAYVSNFVKNIVRKHTRCVSLTMERTTHTHVPFAQLTAGHQGVKGATDGRARRSPHEKRPLAYKFCVQFTHKSIFFIQIQQENKGRAGELYRGNDLVSPCCRAWLIFSSKSVMHMAPV